MSGKRILYSLTIFLFLCFCHQVLLAKDLYLKVVTRQHQEIIYQFDGYDDDRLTFELKLGKKDREIGLRDIQSIYFDTTAITDSVVSVDSLDNLIFRDGKTIKAMLKKIDKDEIKVSVFEDKLRDHKFPVAELQRIDFSLNILDVDRREFGKGFNLFGEGIEIELGNTFASQTEQEAEIIDDTLVNNYIDRLGKKIASFSKRPNLEYSFKVINTKDINAFTVGGGRVFVNRGLIDHVDNESELAGVLAHEIGHNVGKHVAKKISKTLLYNGILTATGELIKTESDKWAKIFEQAGGVVAFFSLMDFSRDEEREADFLGVYNLYAVGYDPNGMVTLFDKFKKLEGSEPSAFEMFFRTHPKSSERMENTTGEIAKLQVEYLKKDDPEFQRVKEHLAQLPKPVITKILVNDTLLVAAGNIGHYHFKLDLSNVDKYVLKGKFAAGGGSGNDVEAYLFDELNFANWINGHEAKSLYSSGRITVGEIQIDITKSGTYYVAFSNSFSLFSDKNVVSIIWVEYTEK